MDWVIGVLIAVVVLFAIYMGIALFAFNYAIVRPKKPSEPKDELRKKRKIVRDKNNANLYALNPEDLSIKSSDGLTLKAWYLPAEKETKRFVICVHGYHCNGPDEFSHTMPFYHYDLGYNYLLPDLRAHGRSEGKYIGFGALDHKDILLWVDYLIERFGDDIEIILHGISMGAATVMLTNEANPPKQVKLVIEDCGYSNAFDQICCTMKDTIGFNFPMLVRTASWICKKRAGYRFEEADCIGKMKDAKNPILFIHGTKDTFVPTYMGKALYEACTVPKDILLVEGAIHAYSYYDARDDYQAKVKEFIDKHIGLTANN